MARKVGSWIDHSKAVLVVLDGDRVETTTITSGIDRRPRAKGGAPSTTPYGAQDAVYEGRQDRRFQQHLDDYYQEVASAIGGAVAVLLMGPGGAKAELRKKLESAPAGPERIETETTDKLTERQIVAKVKEHYGYQIRGAG